MKLTASVLALFTIITFQAAGQDDSTSLKSRYEMETIYLIQNGYIKNDIKYRLKNISEEFQNGTESFQQFQIFKSDNRNYRNFLYPGILLYISGLIVLNQNYDAGLGLLTGSVVFSTITLHFAIRADKNLKKAVWLRNRDILFK